MAPAEAPPVEVLLADGAGFCRGVRRAVDLAEELLRQGPARSLGPLLHNPQEVERLARAGLRLAEPEELRGGERLLLRSHGTPLEGLEGVAARCEIHDATCPYVRSCQNIANRVCAEGYALLLVGDPGHAETEAVLSYARAGAAELERPQPIKSVQGPEELDAVLPVGLPRLAVLAQTTLDLDRLAAVVTRCLATHREVRVFNTICEATTRRQDAARHLALQVDLVLVVGGRHSANTRRLARVCRELQPDTHQVQKAGELRRAWFEGARRVGVTAGASTPDRVIQDVVERIKDLTQGERDGH